MQTLKAIWVKEPVVCFSIALGTVGLSLPLIIPRFWAKYPDAIETDKRVAAAHERQKRALYSSST